MRFKLIARFLLFAGLCVCLASIDMLLREGLAVQNSRIVFTSTRHRNADIYVMDADGGNQERLTHKSVRDVDPTWSPDRSNIAFVSDRGGEGHQIYVMDARGKRAIKLTDGPRKKGDPDWSPDGRKIAFTSWDGQDRWKWENPRIIVMDADGNNPFKLTDGESPSWSPDGRRIAFTTGSNWKDQICVIGVDGNGFERVTKGAAIKGTPAWSPDGKRIAYTALFLEVGTYQIYVIGVDGRNRVRLTHNEENHWSPAWSPDGRMIAYYVWDGILEGKLHGTIHLMTSDGIYLRQLSHGRHARDYQPDISPLGLAVSPASKTTTIWGRLKKSASDLR